MDDLEVVWSGALEAAGKVGGLSSFRGRSTLYPTGNWLLLETLESGEINRHPNRKPPIAIGALDAQALRMLKLGMSYTAIGKQLGCSTCVPRKVARQNGIDRRQFSSNWRHRLDA